MDIILRMIFQVQEFNQIDGYLPNEGCCSDSGKQPTVTVFDLRSLSWLKFLLLHFFRLFKLGENKLYSVYADCQRTDGAAVLFFQYFLRPVLTNEDERCCVNFGCHRWLFGSCWKSNFPLIPHVRRLLGRLTINFNSIVFRLEEFMTLKWQKIVLEKYNQCF